MDGIMEQRMDDEIERGKQMYDMIYEAIFKHFDEKVGFSASDSKTITENLVNKKVPYVSIKRNP